MLYKLQIANEISDAISNPVGMAADYDEDDLLAELDELEQEELDKHLLEVISSTYFSSTHFSSTYFSLPFVACCSVRGDGSDSVVKK